MIEENFLKEAITHIAGKSAEDITKILSQKKYVNEFLIAKKLHLTINQARNILYKLSDAGVVSSIRKKDRKKGWFTYFWKIEPLKSLEFLSHILLKNIEQINSQIKSRESKQFYICERCNIEHAEEKALLQDFICTECGEVFKIKDNSKFVKDLKKNFEKNKNKLFLINKEIEEEKEKLEKEKFKENKKLDKAKADETRKKRLARKKQKKAETSKKKPSKNKISKKKNKKIKKVKKRR